MVMEFCMHIGNSAALASAKFQNDWKLETPISHLRDLARAFDLTVYAISIQRFDPAICMSSSNVGGHTW